MERPDFFVRIFLLLQRWGALNPWQVWPTQQSYPSPSKPHTYIILSEWNDTRNHSHSIHLSSITNFSRRQCGYSVDAKCEHCKLRSHRQCDTSKKAPVVKPVAVLLNELYDGNQKQVARIMRLSYIFCATASRLVISRSMWFHETAGRWKRREEEKRGNKEQKNEKDEEGNKREAKTTTEKRWIETNTHKRTLDARWRRRGQCITISDQLPNPPTSQERPVNLIQKRNQCHKAFESIKAHGEDAWTTTEMSWTFQQSEINATR